MALYAHGWREIRREERGGCVVIHGEKDLVVVMSPLIK